MTTLRLFAVAALLLTALDAGAVRTPADAPRPPPPVDCRRHLMQVDHLRQLYTGGAGMQLRVSPVPEGIDGLTAARVYEAAWRKLAAHDLHDPDAAQWLDVNVNVGARQVAMIVSLRRWTDDLGYGLPGEITVWALGGGGYHDGKGGAGARSGTAAHGRFHRPVRAGAVGVRGMSSPWQGLLDRRFPGRVGRPLVQAPPLKP